MDYVVVSKQEVIQAIWTENLVSGNWFGRSDTNTVGTACSVCAVGAVFRHILNEDTSKYGADSVIWEQIQDKAANRKFNVASPQAKPKKETFKLAESWMKSNRDMMGSELAALSHVFESICKARNLKDDMSRHQLYRLRKDLAQFVEDNFPKKIKVPVGLLPVKSGFVKKDDAS